MEPEYLLDELLTHAAAIGISIRREPLGGEGGGLCTLKGKRVLFVDMSADPLTRFENTLKALAPLPDWNERYVSPALREALDRLLPQ